MHRQIRIIVSLIFCGQSLIAAPAILDDFERDAPGIPSSPALTVSLDASAGKPAEGRALSLGWPAPHGRWIECFYQKPLPIPALIPDATLAIEADIWIPAAPSVVQLGLRLVDAQHELFQWSVNLSPAPTSGWQKVSLPIDLANANAHWGGNNNGRVEFPLKLGGYAAVFANGNIPAGRLLVDNVRVAPFPGITLTTDRFPSLVNATGSSVCALTITNTHDKPLRISLKGKLADFNGDTREIAGEAQAPAGGLAQLPLDLVDRKPGIQRLDCTLSFNDQPLKYKATFVVGDPVEHRGSKNDFLFGICSHTERLPESEQEQEIRAAAATGATVLRMGDAWASLEPKPGEWHWAKQDRLVELAEKYGLETQPILGYGPAHATSPELQAAQTDAYRKHQADAWKITLFGPPEEAPWRRYVSEMVRRYRGRIRLYEVWNEPDLGFWRGTTDEYIRLLRIAHEELQNADPSALLLTGGFATVLDHQGRSKNPDLQERVLSEASDAFDVHAFHQHGTFPEFQTAVDGELKQIRSKMTTPRPLYFNETAISSAYIGERQQALTLVKKTVFAMARGAIGYTWYDLRNDGTDPVNMEHNYGLLTSGFQPKAAFAAYSELIRRLQGSRFIQNLDSQPGMFSPLFQSSRSYVAVLWSERPDESNIPVLIHCGQGPVRLSTIMGNTQTLPTEEGIALVQPNTEPVYLELSATTQPPAIASVLAHLNLPAVAPPDQPLMASAQLTNPLSRNLKIRLSWRDPLDRETNTTVSVPAKGQSLLPVSFPAATTRKTQATATLRFDAVGTPWKGALTQTIPVVLEVSKTTPDERQADWTLDKPQDYFSFCQADPALAALTWKGPSDLSAKIWAWHDTQNLRLRVDVRDDTHVQKESAVGIWRDDSIQLALLYPGITEMLEIGVAQTPDGKVVRSVWTQPAGMQISASDFEAISQVLPDGLRYELAIPYEKLGMTDAIRKKGFRFNLIVNDNDGNLREGFIRIAPGLGETKDSSAFPLLMISTPQ